jgi:hypothetical protein
MYMAGIQPITAFHQAIGWLRDSRVMKSCVM